MCRGGIGGGGGGGFSGLIVYMRGEERIFGGF